MHMHSYQPRVPLLHELRIGARHQHGGFTGFDCVVLGKDVRANH